MWTYKLDLETSISTYIWKGRHGDKRISNNFRCGALPVFLLKADFAIFATVITLKTMLLKAAGLSAD